MANADRESRVKPQPLQPEELKAVQEYLARFDGPPQLYVNLPAPPPLVQLALDPRRLIATIEEARRAFLVLRENGVVDFDGWHYQIIGAQRLEPTTVYPKKLDDGRIIDAGPPVEEARREQPRVPPGNTTALSDSRMAELRHDIEECERGGILEWTVNARLKWSELKSLLGTIDRRADTYRKPGEGFVCFHCGERFTDYESAKEHFGEKPDADARCIEEARRGKPFSMLREKMTPEAREKSGAIAADILDWKSKFEAEHARASELQATLDSIRRESSR